MFTKDLSALNIHKLTQEQFDRELANGNIDENALYLTPDEDNEILNYIKYTINEDENGNKTVAITECDTSISGTYVIPDIIEGHPVVRLAGSAFENCTNLTSIAIPNTVTHCGEFVFASCINLSNVILSDNLIEIGHSMFEGCISLTNIIIPDTIITIGGDAFVNCTNLTSMTIGKGVEVVLENVFNGCDNLTEVYYTGSMVQWRNINDEYGSLTLIPKPRINQDYFADVTSDDDSNVTLQSENELHVSAPCIDLSGESAWMYVGHNDVEIMCGDDDESRAYIDDNSIALSTVGNISMSSGDGLCLRTYGDGLWIESHTTGISIDGDSTVDINSKYMVRIGDKSPEVKIKNVVTPTEETDAVNKGYVDDTITETIQNFLVVSPTQPNAADYPEGALWIQPLS